MKRRKAYAPAPEREELERQLEALQRDIRQLQLEHDLLKKANELLKKGLGVDLQLLSNREKTQLVDALKDTYRLSELLLQLGVARSSYFYHRTRVNLEDKYVTIRRNLTEIFESNHRCYGYRRLQALLARQSVTISEKVVQRLMKQESLVVARPRRRRFGSYMGEISPAPENLINRDFRAKTPNEKWLTDITEFQIPAGKVYLSPIIDCFDGMVISGQLERNRMRGWSTRCWTPPSRPLPTAKAGRSSTLIVERIIAGPAGSRGLAMRSCYVRCLARAVHRITPRAKASSVG